MAVMAMVAGCLMIRAIKYTTVELMINISSQISMEKKFIIIQNGLGVLKIKNFILKMTSMIIGHSIMSKNDNLYISSFIFKYLI